MNKKFFIILFITLFLNNLSFGNSEIFQIEDISLNQKISDHLKDIENVQISFDYPNKKYATIILNKNNHNMKIYDGIHLYFEWKDQNKFIKSIYGFQNIESYEECSVKQSNVLNEIYKTFSEDVEYVRDNDDVIAEDMTKHNSDVVVLKNGNLIKIQCYDHENTDSYKRGHHPRFTFAIGLNSKKYERWLLDEALKIGNKNKLNEFEIEEFTINESLLKYMSREKIDMFKKFKMNKIPNHYSIQILENLKIYNLLVLTLDKNDKNFNIIGIRGIKYFGNFKKCINEKNDLFNYLLDYLNTNVDRALKLPIQSLKSSKGNHTITTDFFMYKNGNEINITCDKVPNSNRTIFEVGFYSKYIRGLN